MPIIEAGRESTSIDSKFGTPLGSVLGNSIESQHSICFRIVRLLFCCFPPAIVLAVGAIVVNSPYARLVEWNLSHIFQEVYEHLPSLTDINTASTVTMPFGGVGVIASSRHQLPTMVSSSSTHTMFGSSFADKFPIKAPATQYIPGPNRTHIDGNDFATIALACPPSMPYTIGSLCSFGLTKYKEASVSLSGKVHSVFAFIGRLSYNGIRHGFCSYQESCLEPAAVRPVVGLSYYATFRGLVKKEAA